MKAVLWVVIGMFFWSLSFAGIEPSDKCEEIEALIEQGEYSQAVALASDFLGAQDLLDGKNAEDPIIEEVLACLFEGLTNSYGIENEEEEDEGIPFSIPKFGEDESSTPDLEALRVAFTEFVELESNAIGPNHPARMDTLIIIVDEITSGEEKYKREILEEASGYLDEIIRIAKKIDPIHEKYAEALSTKAANYAQLLDLEDVPDAAQIYQKAKNIFTEAIEVQEKVVAAKKEAKAKDPDEILPSLSEALLDLADLYQDLGNLHSHYYRRKEGRKSLADGKKAMLEEVKYRKEKLEITDAVQEDRLKLVDALRNLATFQKDLGQREEAFANWEEARQVLKLVENDPGDIDESLIATAKEQDAEFYKSMGVDSPPCADGGSLMSPSDGPVKDIT